MSHFTCAECNSYLGRLKLLNSTFDLSVEFNSVEFNKLFLSKGKIYLLQRHIRSVRNLVFTLS